MYIVKNKAELEKCERFYDMLHEELKTRVESVFIDANMKVCIKCESICELPLTEIPHEIEIDWEFSTRGLKVMYSDFYIVVGSGNWEKTKLIFPK